MNEESLRLLQNYIMQNPNKGDIIENTGGLMKLRWSMPHTGKSGGARVLYVDFIFQETVILVDCYGKDEKATISDKEKAMYKEFIKAIGRELRK